MLSPRACPGACATGDGWKIRLNELRQLMPLPPPSLSPSSQPARIFSVSLVTARHHHHKHKQHIIIMITLVIFVVITTNIGNTTTGKRVRAAAATATATTISSTQPLLRHQKPLSFQFIMCAFIIAVMTLLRAFMLQLVSRS